MANRRLSLGIKQVNDIWSNWFSAHKVGDLVRGKVARTAPFGAFVEVGEGIEALCHISEIEDHRRGRDKGDRGDRGDRGDKDKNAKGKGANQLEVGQEYDFKIVKMDPDQHKIGLSFRGAQKQAERREMEQYRSSRSSGGATIGDAIMAKRGGTSL